MGTLPALNQAEALRHEKPPPHPLQFENGDKLDHSNPYGTGLPAFAMDKSGEGL